MEDRREPAGKRPEDRKKKRENEVQPSRKADAAVGLGDGLEGAPIEEYEEEQRIGKAKSRDS